MRITSSRALRLLVVAALVPLFGLGANSRVAAAPPTVSSTLNQYGFPIWYEDATGVRVEPCMDPLDTAHCILLTNPGVYDSQQPIVFPSNFPDEHFYAVTDSEKLTTPGCPTATPGSLAFNPGKAFVRAGLEGAFANGLPAVGDQMVFGRVRISVRGGLCPNTPYAFTHPYGTTTITTDVDGSVKPTAGTVDIGCVPVPGTPCGFTQATASPVLSVGLLRWDPNVAPAADPGYLGGDAAVLHPITGGVNNTFTIAGGHLGSPVSTNLFTVSGKIAGPVVSSKPLV